MSLKKRKGSQIFKEPESSKRLKQDDTTPPPLIEPSIYPCEICTSLSTDGIAEFDIINQARITHCHLSCIELIPEMRITPKKDPAQKRTTVVLTDPLIYFQRSSELACSICPDNHGVKIQCTAGKCVKAFHINCAQSQEGVAFEIKPEGSPTPYRLMCEGHNKTAQIALKKSREGALRAYALSHAAVGTPIVVRSSSGKNEVHVVSVDMAKEQVMVTSEGPPFDQVLEEDTYIVDFKAIVINDQLRKLIPPTKEGGSTSNRKPQPSSTTTSTSLVLSRRPALLTPPSSHASQAPSQAPSEPLFLPSQSNISPEEPIYIASSASSISSDVEVLELLDPVENRETHALDLVPGLMDRIVQFLINDPEWSQRISECSGE